MPRRLGQRVVRSHLAGKPKRLRRTLFDCIYMYIAGTEQKREAIVTRKCVEMGID